MWLAPVEGVFRDLREGNPFDPPTDFARELEPGVTLRSLTESDERLIDDWFQFFERYVAEPEVESARAADLVLRSDMEPDGFPEKVTAFVLSLSLHTRTALTARALHFDLDDAGEVDRRLGHAPESTFRLRNWQEAQPMLRVELGAVAETYPHLARIRRSPHLGQARSLGAYRAAVSRAGFVDAVPILACASLEALAATARSSKVIHRLVPRYVSEDSATQTLESFYRLRHWFAHGATIPEMRDAEVRLRLLDEGLAVVKEILLRAYSDHDLLKASESGVKAVRTYLDG